MGVSVAAIGTTHPWNVAGIGLDLARASRRGVHVASVIVAVSVQDELGVHAVMPLSCDSVAAQMHALRTLDVRAARVGLIPTSALVRTVGAQLERFACPVIADPVYAASIGGALQLEDTRDAYLGSLLPRCTLVTPNLAEAAWLTGFPVTTVAEMEAAGAWLVARGARAVLVKGGHLAGDPCDVLVDARGARMFHGERLPQTLRGTGDLLAFGIASALARDATLAAAIADARAFVRTAIARGVMRGGMRVAE